MIIAIENGHLCGGKSIKDGGSFHMSIVNVDKRVPGGWLLNGGNIYGLHMT